MKQSALKRLEFRKLTLVMLITFVVALIALTMTSGSAFSGSGARTLEPQTTAQESKTDGRELKPGAPIERELLGGEDHSYRVALTAGQYMKVVVEQEGIDVVVRVFGPDGKQITEQDNHPTVGMETVFLIAEVSGRYQLEVRSQNKDAETGRYEMRVEELREATSKDRVQVTAEKVFEEANQLRDQRTAESRRKAIKKYEEALPQWQEAGDKEREANTLNEIGVIYDNLSEPKKALEYYEQAVPLYQAAGERINKANTLGNMGLSYWRLGESQKALNYHEQALQLQRAVGDRQGEAATLNAIGLVYSLLSQFQEALEYYNRALPLERIVGDRLFESTTLNNIGTVYKNLGDLQRALESYNQALPLKRAAADRQGEAHTLRNIGGVYYLLGEDQKTLEYDNQALALFQAVGNSQGEAVTIDAIGLVHGRSMEMQKALECFSRALAISQAMGDRLMQATILSHYAQAYNYLGEPRKALIYSNQALPLRRAIGDRQGEAVSLSVAGDSYASLGEWQKALEYFRTALQLSRDVGNRISEANRLNEIAHVERKLGNMKEARAQIESALSILESTRAKVISQELRTSFLASRQDYYEFYIDVLMQLHQEQPTTGHDATALVVSERERARGLLDILTEARADIRQGVDLVLLERESSLQQQLNAKSERLTRLLSAKHTDEQETGARKEVKTLLTDYQDVEAEIRATSPRYAALTQPQALSVKEIQQVLDKETVLLEYALGEERSYLWAVTPTSVTSFELPKRADIKAAATKVYEALTARNKLVRFEKKENKQARVAEADAEYFAASADLSQMLLGPVVGQLGTKRLLIVSEGALQYVPFGALPAPSAERSAIRGQRSEVSKAVSFEPLIASHEVVSLPSASTLAVLRKEMVGRQRGAKTVAVLADPVFQDDDPRVKRDPAKTGKQAAEPSSKSTETRGLETEIERSARDTGDLEFRRLPYSRQEAEGIAALASNAMRKKSLDFEANRTTATGADLSNYRIIHFATHGLLDSQHPELSGIVLSLVDKDGKPQDGFLRLNEIYNLKLGADLVVLSACRTALGKEIKGEGLVGLTRGFMYAGAPRVVASLWAVDDEITAELMKRFYGEMLIKGRRPAAALRAAQVSIWKERRLPPYYWAAFVLQGEWK